MTFIIFLLVLGITVFIHELGHFIFAKKAGVHIYEFSIGMGPRIHTWKRKKWSNRLFNKIISNRRIRINSRRRWI